MSCGRFTDDWKPLDLGSPVGPREKRVFALPMEAVAASALRVHCMSSGEGLRVPPG